MQALRRAAANVRARGLLPPSAARHLAPQDRVPLDNLLFRWRPRSRPGKYPTTKLLIPFFAQIYLLWDRIIGFESVEVVTVLAVAIMVFRANYILNVNTQEEFDELFSDLSQMKVLPLL